MARKIGDLFKAIGLLRKGHCVEVDRSKLTGAHWRRRPAGAPNARRLTLAVLFEAFRSDQSVRSLPDNILLLEKAANFGVGLGHLHVGKSAVLAAGDGY